MKLLIDWKIPQLIEIFLCHSLRGRDSRALKKQIDDDDTNDFNDDFSLYDALDRAEGNDEERAKKRRYSKQGISGVPAGVQGSLSSSIIGDDDDDSYGGYGGKRGNICFTCRSFYGT